MLCLFIINLINISLSNIYLLILFIYFIFILFIYILFIYDFIYDNSTCQCNYGSSMNVTIGCHVKFLYFHLNNWFVYLTKINKGYNILLHVLYPPKQKLFQILNIFFIKINEIMKFSNFYLKIIIRYKLPVLLWI